MRKRVCAVPVALLLLTAMFLTACTGNTPTASETPTATESVSETVSESVSETVTESGSESVTETASETVTETETEPEIETVPQKEAACYVLTYLTDNRGRIREQKAYYRSVGDAVAANPEGADIRLCRDASETDRGVVFPETGEFALHTVQFNYDFSEYYETGAVYEITEHYFTERAYFTSLSGLLAYFSDAEYADYRMPLADYSVWVFSAENGYDAGKYYVTVTADGFRLDRECGIEYWYRTAFFSVDTRVFYTLAQLHSFLEEHPETQTIHVINDYAQSEPIEFDYDDRIRLSYDGNRVDASFSWGATFDDGRDGLCYYCDINMLLSTHKDVLCVKDSEKNVISCLYIWTDDEGYQPGKYRISEDLSIPDESDPKTGNATVFCVGELKFIWTAPIDSFRDDHLQ